MTHIILMPALSPTMEHGSVARWLVNEGDEIHVGDLIAEIETEKAVMEMQASTAGIIERILVGAGSEGVPINTPIASLRPVIGAPAASQHADDETMAAAVAAAVAATAESSCDHPGASADPDDIRATPLARRMAVQSGIKLDDLEGSGPGGQISKSDVQAAMAGAVSKPVAATLPPQPRTLEQLGIPASSYQLIALDGMRRTIARRLTDAARDVPHFSLTVDVELDALVAARARINCALENRGGVRISVNDIVIKAVANALRRVPQVNASFTPEGIALHHDADIAVAVAVDGGLVTPIVRRADTKSLAEIAREMVDLSERARAKKLRPDEFQGGTFSISNLGMYGIRSFNSIINEPHGAILSVGAAEQRAIVRQGALAVATMMAITLSCDHRVVDGVAGARFLTTLADLMADPVLLLA